ncbi:MAG: hypothetical protein ACTTKN_09560 [Phocaeicola sp.]|uniref:Cbp1 family collagen-binding glycoprotein adhesin n=1 Tax=Phocaeicola TaxID=909656 RepID=UPI00234ECB75|nr:hypothetical protein [Phocaeicola oris]MCE2616846.1 hypothetical protein [Phocaeicola oris]
MKKILLLSFMTLALFSCNNGAKQEAMKAQNDSLMVQLANRNAELDDIMGAFNEVQEGFREINEAENRVDLSSAGAENNPDKIKENIRFISEKLKANREQIVELQKKLQGSTYQSAQLKKAISNLTKELESKEQQIQDLQAELANKNIRITELDDAVAMLNEDVTNLKADNKEKEATVASQDKALNAAWFVFGTKSELKEQKILVDGDVLKNKDFNKDYFTQIDIRTDKAIKLYSKNATLLTTHPAGSYSLDKDDKGQLTLNIIKPSDFWSVSRYLVIKVK